MTGLQSHLIQKDICLPITIYFCIFFFFFGYRSEASDQAKPKENIVLSIGATHSISAKGRIHFSNNGVLRAIDLGSKVQIVGRRLGAVDIESTQRTFHVDVIGSRDFQLFSKLDHLIKQMRGLNVHIQNGKIQIVGELLRKSDWLSLAQSHIQGANYQFRAKMDDATKIEMTQYFHQLLKSSELPITSMQMIPFAHLSLSKSLFPLKVRYERDFAPFGFVVDKSSSLLQLEPLVRVNILVAEIRKNMSRTLGILLPGAANASLLPNFQVPSEGEGLSAQINALENQGNGHLLAAPTLLCRSGKNAEFLAGGEIPIKIVNQKYHETTWKKYGVLLKVSPLADSTGRMSIALTTEVSMLDPSHSIEGVPALLTNRIESHFDLKKSRTIALSGLLKSEWFRNSEGLPGLSQIPVLGYLFSSKAYKNDETELVIFVTPEVIQPESIDEEAS